jgi:predicted cupin superfamily sugar epimerase
MATQRQMKHRKDMYIRQLGLEKHSIEPGFFKETYRSRLEMPTADREGGRRNVSTVIYYMMVHDATKQHSGARFFRNRSDIVHFYHDGWPAQYMSVAADGEVTTVILGKCNIKDQQLHIYIQRKPSETIQELFSYAQ